MSQYSETMGSFTRVGDYPLETNYIFKTEEELKTFYADEVNATTMHKGLLRIVESDSEGMQSLWWVVAKEGSEELEFRRLITFVDIPDLLNKIDLIEKDIEGLVKKDDEQLEELNKLTEKLKKFKEKLKTYKAELQATVGTDAEDLIAYLQTLPYKSLTEATIALHKFLETVDAENPQILTFPELQHFLAGYTDRDNLKKVLEDLYNKILGTPVPSERYNTFRKVEDAIKILRGKAEKVDKDLQDEIDETQKGVGLDSSGRFSPDAFTHYLKEATSVMNALRTLDQLIYEAMTNVNLEPEDTKTIDMRVVPLRDKTTISAEVKLATREDNQIIIDQDGIYHKVDFNYENGRLDLIVNGSSVKYFDLGISGIVSKGYYDDSTEELVIILSLKGGEESTLRIPVHGLIEEWTVINDAEHAIFLDRKREVNGQSTLSADVKISTNNKNILRKDASGRLLVKGTADNISMTSGETVELAIKDINENVSDYSKSINDLRGTLRDVQTDYRELSGKVSTNTTDLEKVKEDVRELEDFKLTHEKDYEQVNKELESLKITVDGKVSTVALHKDNDRAYTILVDGKEIGTIDIPSQAVIADVSYDEESGILVIKFNSAETEDVRIDFKKLVSEALKQVEEDVNTLKTDVLTLKEKDVVEWNKTGENKAIYLEKDNAISAKFENEDTRTPIVQVIEDKTHLGSSHFPTSIDSSVRPIIKENETEHQVAYLDDIPERLTDRLDSIESDMRDILESLTWRDAE